MDFLVLAYTLSQLPKTQPDFFAPHSLPSSTKIQMSLLDYECCKKLNMSVI